jgi:hypothetical protein
MLGGYKVSILLSCGLPSDSLNVHKHPTMVCKFRVNSKNVACEIKSDLWQPRPTGKAYVSPVTTLASSVQTALVKGSLPKSRVKT